MGKKKPAELKPSDPEFLPVQYDLTQERLNQLAVDYDPGLIPNAETKGDDGYQEIHNKVMAITKVRTNIERVRKDLKADALAWGRKVDGEAKRLTAEVEKLEAPWRAIKTDLDEAEAREAEAARLAEQKRMEEIEGRIRDIKALGEGLIGANAEAIQIRIDRLREIPIGETLYGEYAEAAEVTRDTLLSTLIAMHSERKAFEDQQAELARQQQYLAAERQKQAEAQKELDKQKAAQEAAEAAEKAKAEKAAREAALKKRLPEDKKLRAYLDDLLAVKPPKIKDKALAETLAEVERRLTTIARYIYDNTQEAETKAGG